MSGSGSDNGNTTPNLTPTPTPTTMEVRRTISPYDLTAADNPGAVISHPLLKGSNYDEWACGIKTALSSRKKYGFLDGSIARPAEGSADLEDWWTIQALLVSWIKMTIDPSLRSNISHRDVAKDLWDHLKKRFSVTNGPRIQQLKAELACCKQRGLAIEAYYGKLNRIWDNMAQYRPLRTCKCGKCECQLGFLQEQDREEEKVHEFLSGLDESYRTVRSTLVSRSPIQPLEEVYNVLRQEEDLKTSSRTVDETTDVSAYAVQTRSRVQQPRNDERDRSTLCKHCNRSGHASDSCFAVVGYPEWWADRPRTRTVQGRGRGGGFSSANPGRGRGVNCANAVQVPQIPPATQANYVLTDRDRDGVHGLNDAQWRALMNLLNTDNRTSTATEKLSGPCFEDGDWSG
uniref:Retrotransposon Copia-like N-terminal domain-containing protein n=1 Tax=Noccaea caerulescens TaxID=107243 RepID=A0A1J3CZ11_NOCCA